MTEHKSWLEEFRSDEFQKKTEQWKNIFPEGAGYLTLEQNRPQETAHPKLPML
ncbi:MAG TPA: hypothetical protein PL048_23230 [Leptospiraceae bacterium]|nr:hypothetical protein [Leptospiraceae bacterium]HNF17650.1 hypothetical protein [Leptospiraceae bacterium]HNI27308.1 hypothetical protein [Leptospiraceae bacterium]HNI99125.1 hypothetical protein [Leptospiraceae bacterium]HNM05890.1 hypothetical protein [Leptospiraceae bacterium]